MSQAWSAASQIYCQQRNIVPGAAEAQPLVEALRGVIILLRVDRDRRGLALMEEIQHRGSQRPAVTPSLIGGVNRQPRQMARIHVIGAELIADDARRGVLDDRASGGVADGFRQSLAAVLPQGAESQLVNAGDLVQIGLTSDAYSSRYLGYRRGRLLAAAQGDDGICPAKTPTPGGISNPAIHQEQVDLPDNFPPQVCLSYFPQPIKIIGGAVRLVNNCQPQPCRAGRNSLNAGSVDLRVKVNGRGQNRPNHAVLGQRPAPESGACQQIG